MGSSVLASSFKNKGRIITREWALVIKEWPTSSVNISAIMTIRVKTVGSTLSYTKMIMSNKMASLMILRTMKLWKQVPTSQVSLTITWKTRIPGWKKIDKVKTCHSSRERITMNSILLHLVTTVGQVRIQQWSLRTSWTSRARTRCQAACPSSVLRVMFESIPDRTTATLAQYTNPTGTWMAIKIIGRPARKDAKALAISKPGSR